MNEVPHIIFDTANYESENEMFKAVATTLRILTENNYICSFEFEDCGIYVLRFDFKDQALSQFELRWVAEDGCE